MLFDVMSVNSKLVNCQLSCFFSNLYKIYLVQIFIYSILIYVLSNLEICTMYNLKIIRNMQEY